MWWKTTHACSATRGRQIEKTLLAGRQSCLTGLCTVVWHVHTPTLSHLVVQIFRQQCSGRRACRRCQEVCLPPAALGEGRCEVGRWRGEVYAEGCRPAAEGRRHARHGTAATSQSSGVFKQGCRWVPLTCSRDVGNTVNADTHLLLPPAAAPAAAARLVGADVPPLLDAMRAAAAAAERYFQKRLPAQPVPCVVLPARAAGAPPAWPPAALPPSSCCSASASSTSPASPAPAPCSSACQVTDGVPARWPGGVD